MKDPHQTGAYGGAKGASKDVAHHQTGEAFGDAEDQICLSNGFHGGNIRRNGEKMESNGKVMGNEAFHVEKMKLSMGK